MRAVGVIAFLSGLSLWIRVMFFGVQRRTSDDLLHHRRWPLAAAAFLTVSGALVYGRAVRGGEVTVLWLALVVVVGLAAGALAWWLVQRSAAIPSTDPEDDPRYRFQGHIARVTKAIDPKTGDGAIAFEFEGRTYQMGARWSVSGDEYSAAEHGLVGTEVVIERIEGDVAFVEPWVVVEERL